MSPITTKDGTVIKKMKKAATAAGVVDINDKDAFMTAAKTWQWDREKSVRTLA